MKVLTLNFLTCAVKACKSSNDSFPLHPKDAELVHDDIEINPELLVNVLPRIDWTALKTTSTEVRFFFFLRSSPTHLIHCILLLGYTFLTLLLITSIIPSYWPSLSIHIVLLTPSHAHLITCIHTYTQPHLTTKPSLTTPQLGFPALPDQPPSAEDLQSNEEMLKQLHSLLLETQLMEGKLVCGHCGHEYAVREGIANFLLPSHLV